MQQKCGFLFPGQGSQYVGMAKDLVEACPEAVQKFDVAAEILGFDLAQACFSGPEAELKQTRVTQPAIFVHSCIVLEQLQKRGVTAAMTAGHSLGEYTALVAAGALNFEKALHLVKIRADAMQAAGKKSPGTMAAILGLDADTVDAICAEAAEKGIVRAANYNAPGQIVISGAPGGVHEAMRLAKARGARRAVELVVGGAFHSPLMEAARAQLKAGLDSTAFAPAVLPVYQNVTMHGETDPETIKKNLATQLVHPVRWIGCITQMIRDGAARFYEIGPGKVLTGLVRRIDRSVSVIPVGTYDDLTALSG